MILNSYQLFQMFKVYLATKDHGPYQPCFLKSDQLTWGLICSPELLASGELLASWFQKIFKCLYYEFMGANDIQGEANLNPRGMVDRIYIEDNLTLVHTKYINCGPHGFRRFFKKLFHVISLGDHKALLLYI